MGCWLSKKRTEVIQMGGERWCRREWEVFLESEITRYSSLQALDNCKEGAKRTGSAPSWVLMHSRLRSLDPVLLCRVTEHPPSASISSCQSGFVSQGYRTFQKIRNSQFQQEEGNENPLLRSCPCFQETRKALVSHCPYPSLQTEFSWFKGTLRTQWLGVLC